MAVSETAIQHCGSPTVWRCYLPAWLLHCVQCLPCAASESPGCFAPEPPEPCLEGIPCVRRSVNVWVQRAALPYRVSLGLAGTQSAVGLQQLLRGSPARVLPQHRAADGALSTARFQWRFAEILSPAQSALPSIVHPQTLKLHA
jgi:hypothetical protein